MDDMFDSVKSTSPAEGQTRVYVAGEPEAESEKRRLREGIPINATLMGLVNDLARGLGVPPLCDA
jgi:LDH2 family malate/lactate/ureidoglycolate dehydrogenase